MSKSIAAAEEEYNKKEKDKQASCRKDTTQGKNSIRTAVMSSSKKQYIGVDPATRESGIRVKLTNGSNEFTGKLISSDPDNPSDAKDVRELFVSREYLREKCSEAIGEIEGATSIMAIKQAMVNFLNSINQ